MIIRIQLSCKSSQKGAMRIFNIFFMSSSVKLFYNDVFEVPLPPNHRFPMLKYKLVRESVEKRLQINPKVSFHQSPVATKEELALTHCPDYIERYLSGQLNDNEVRKIGFPWSPQQVTRTITSIGGTVAAMKSVLNASTGCIAAGNMAGGTHHAFYDYGEGYCIFSDIAVATNLALTEYSNQVKSVLIIDLDVHQGNGNAVLFAKNPNVFTFSMHCKQNYFSEKQTSKLDIELEPNCQDAEYLDIVSKVLPSLFVQHEPDLVFYQAGVDIHHQDRLGKLGLTRNGIHQRNLIVYNLAKTHNCRIIATMGGGYTLLNIQFLSI